MISVMTKGSLDDRSEPHTLSHDTMFVGAGFDTWAGSPFVASAPGAFGQEVFLLAFGFFAVINGMLIVVGGVGILPSLVTQANVMHFLSASVMGALWAIARVRSLRTLGILDAGKKIGSGGMGEVWRARHRLLIRPAAVKLVTARALGSGDPDRHAVDAGARRALVESPCTWYVVHATGRRRGAVAGSAPAPGDSAGAQLTLSPLGERRQRLRSRDFARHQSVFHGSVGGVAGDRQPPPAYCLKRRNPRRLCPLAAAPGGPLAGNVEDGIMAPSCNRAPRQEPLCFPR
jgi:hypothetical protein